MEDLPELVIEHVQRSNPPAFKVIFGQQDGMTAESVVVPSPYNFTLEGRPDAFLMPELRWYLENFLDYPFHPETVHAEHVMDSLRKWGTRAFTALFHRRHVSDWFASCRIVQVCSDDPRVLSWPWEALYNPQSEVFLALQRRVERRLKDLPKFPIAANLPTDRVNILLVVSRPFSTDVRYRSVARLLVELIRLKTLPVHVDILRPPTFDQLRERLSSYPGYYHVLHFDGHGFFRQNSNHSDPSQGAQGCLIFENDLGEADAKTAQDLSTLLYEHQVPTVVLNACQSADLARADTDAFAAVATALLQSGTRSVVAMAYSLYVSGAQVFLRRFYECLFESGSVSAAVLAGREQMLADKNRMSARGPYPLEDWLVPVLYQSVSVDFSFVAKAKVETLESRLPKEVVEHDEEFGFVGRDGPILEIERALNRPVPCILLRGIGGIGKTTLARGFLRWLDETGGLDRALWFDFREVRTYEYVVNTVGQMFHGDNFGIASNKLELLAKAFEQNRIVMVWDNFESTADYLTDNDRVELVRFLDIIYETKSKVLMTSRTPEAWLPPSRRFQLILGGLEGEERWQYCQVVLSSLGLRVDRSDPELVQLMDQLHGHPLAMRAVLPQLDRMTVSKLAEALRSNLAALDISEQAEHERLFSTLRFVERGLPEDLRPMVGLVGLHESYVDIDGLAEMAKHVHPPWTTRCGRLMAELSAAGLARAVDKSTFEVHPLLTSYLRSRPLSEPYERAFVDVMGNVANHLAPRPLHEQNGTFSFHMGSFYHARRVAQRLSLHRQVAMLTQSLAAHAQSVGNFAEASRMYLDLVQQAISWGNSELKGVAYQRLGLIAIEQRHFEDALESSLKALAIAEATDNPNGAATACHSLGVIFAEQRDFEKAQEWYLKSLAISEKQGDGPGPARTYHQLGNIAERQRDFGVARKWYLQSLASIEGNDDLPDVAIVYDQLGRIAGLQQDPGTARDWLLKSLTIKERQGDDRAKSVTFFHLGEIEMDERQFETARDWLLKSLAITERLGDLRRSAFTYHHLGSIAREQNNFEAAREWYLKSLAIKEKQHDPHNLAITHAQLGNLSTVQGRFEEGGKWFVSAIGAFARMQDQDLVDRHTGNFLVAYQQATPDVKKILKTLWLENGLGSFPKDRKVKPGQ